MGQPISILDYAKKQWGADALVTKALSASNLSEGGALIPPDVASDIIPLLRPASAVDSLNPVFMPMPTGKIDVPKVTGGASASYIGENEDIPKTQQAFGMVSLVAKKLAALVPISNDLLLRTTGADTIVRDDTVASLAQRGDLAKIRGLGTEHSPRGLRYQAASGNIIPANATVNLANVTDDLKKVFNAIEATNAKMIRPAWILSPRSKNYLMFVRDSNGNLVWHDEMKGGTLLGFPFRVTTQIPNNLGSGTDESEVYFADFADVVVGETGSLRVDISTEAAYMESGSLKSAFSLDQTVVRVIQEHDLGVRYDGSIVVLTAVKWI
jgi:HK97 family phage major capsid protein